MNINENRKRRIYWNGRIINLDLNRPEVERLPYKHIEVFNEIWQQKRIRTPLLILIGGYAGTGKSTVARAIIEEVNYTSVLATGFIRSFVQSIHKPENEPALSMNTYDLHRLNSNSDNPGEIIEAFKRQRYLVAEGIENAAKFVVTEHQHTIVDGNHVSPDCAERVAKLDGLIPISFYVKVSDADTHRQMISGPTHSRILDDGQFRTARILHDFMVREVEDQNFPIFEYNEASSRALEMIDQALVPIVSPYL